MIPHVRHRDVVTPFEHGARYRVTETGRALARQTGETLPDEPFYVWWSPRIGDWVRDNGDSLNPGAIDLGVMEKVEE